MVVKFIMQGLLPISDAAKTYLNKRFTDGEFLIGMDPALLLGDPQVISTGLLFIPLTILIATIVPGNQVLPFGDLATISFFIAVAVAIHKGNIFRSLISGSVIMYITIWISNQMIDLQTALGEQVGLVAEGTRVSSLDQAGSPITYILANILDGQFPMGVIVILVIYVLAFGYTFISAKRNKLYVPDED